MTGLGIDLGSRQAKFALLDGHKIVWLKVFDTIPFYKLYGGMRGLAAGRSDDDRGARCLPPRFQGERVEHLA